VERHDTRHTGITELLDAAGLRTPKTAKRPPAALARSAVHHMLKDDYYTGVVTFEGAKNPDGLHPPLIDVVTFERVQAVLNGHALSGDRSHEHEHYLKGSVFCGQCEGRLIFTPVRGNGGPTNTSAASGGTTCETAATRPMRLSMPSRRPWSGTTGVMSG
jgi:hypothetical protein